MRTLGAQRPARGTYCPALHAAHTAPPGPTTCRSGPLPASGSRSSALRGARLGCRRAPHEGPLPSLAVACISGVWARAHVEQLTTHMTGQDARWAEMRLVQQPAGRALKPPFCIDSVSLVIKLKHMRVAVPGSVPAPAAHCTHQSTPSQSPMQRQVTPWDYWTQPPLLHCAPCLQPNDCDQDRCSVSGEQTVCCNCQPCVARAAGHHCAQLQW